MYLFRHIEQLPEQKRNELYAECQLKSLNYATFLLSDELVLVIDANEHTATRLLEHYGIHPLTPVKKKQPRPSSWYR